MTSSRVTTVLALAVVVLLGNSSRLRADDSTPPSLADIHQVLLQAAGDSPDTMPAADQQKQLIDHAIKMIRHVPHVYHGVLNHASRELEQALVELSSGDASHKARGDILDADDLIKSIKD